MLLQKPLGLHAEFRSRTQFNGLAEPSVRNIKFTFLQVHYTKVERRRLMRRGPA